MTNNLSPALDIRNVIVWGNISGSFYIDLQWTKVFNYDGAIKGPAFFSQPALKLLHQRFATTVNPYSSWAVYPEIRPLSPLPGNGWRQTFKTWHVVGVRKRLQSPAERPPCRPPTGSSPSWRLGTAAPMGSSLWVYFAKVKTQLDNGTAIRANVPSDEM